MQKTKTMASVIFPVAPQKILSDRQIDNRIKKLAELEEETKKIKKEVEAIKAEIISAMPAAELTTSHYKIHYTTYPQKRIDTAALKKALPEVAEKYTKISQSHKFTYSEI